MSKLYIYNTSSIIKYMSSESGGIYGRHQSLFSSFIIYNNIIRYYVGGSMIETLFELEDTFRSWTVSLEFMTGSCMILFINLINYLRA